jgi:hypothetical protein
VVEQGTHKPLVGGSNPPSATKSAPLSRIPAIYQALRPPLWPSGYGSLQSPIELWSYRRHGALRVTCRRAGTVTTEALPRPPEHGGVDWRAPLATDLADGHDARWRDRWRLGIIYATESDWLTHLSLSRLGIDPARQASSTPRWWRSG